MFSIPCVCKYSEREKHLLDYPDLDLMLQLNQYLESYIFKSLKPFVH